jgi:hypothetical protein
MLRLAFRFPSVWATHSSISGGTSAGRDVVISMIWTNGSWAPPWLALATAKPDTPLDLTAGATRPDLAARIRGHVPGRDELVATCQRA